MNAKKINILLVDQAETILKLGKKLLQRAGFNVSCTADPKVALKLIARENPKVVIIEADLAGISGYDITRKLKSDVVTYQIPVIITTVSTDGDFVDKAMAAGADDFLVKPFDPPIIKARIQMVLERIARERSCNPVTGLAGNVVIDNYISEQIKAKKKFAVCYVDINSFRQYNLRYGHTKGIEVIKTTGKIINMVLRRFPHHDCCLGHLGESHFVFTTGIDIIENVCSRIIDTFNEVVPSLYDSTSNKRGYIHLKNRAGKVEKVPLLTLVMGVVTNENRAIEHISVISDIAWELKSYAKTFGDSIFVIDRRK